MKLLDLFRKKEERKKLEGPAEARKKAPAPSSGAETETKNLGESEVASVVLQKPRVTEKSSKMSERGVYVFRVAGRSRKPEIKKAVEELYKVKVEKVNIVSVPFRLRLGGRKIGHKPGYKKASVRLVWGHKIEFI